MMQGEQALKDIDSAKSMMPPEAYNLLRIKIEATLDYTKVMTRMELAYLRLRRESITTNQYERAKLLEQLHADALELRDLSLNGPSSTKLTVNGMVVGTNHRCIVPTQWLGKLEDRIKAIEDTNSILTPKEGER
jgi:hypothetical protein